MSTPKPGRWVLDEAQLGLASLHYDASAPATAAADLGPEDVLVEMHAASLNYRDLVIARVCITRLIFLSLSLYLPRSVLHMPVSLAHR
jgi:hypothetical protein